MNNKGVHTAIYARLTEHFKAYLGEERDCRNYAADVGLQVDENHVFVDRNESTKELERLIDMAEQDEPPFDTVVCLNPASMGRTTVESVLMTYHLRKCGVVVCCVTDVTLGTYGELVESVLESVDDYFELTRKNTRGTET